MSTLMAATAHAPQPATFTVYGRYDDGSAASFVATRQSGANSSEGGWLTMVTFKADRRFQPDRMQICVPGFDNDLSFAMADQRPVGAGERRTIPILLSS
jgi:hypothetical protein